jgi:hypothetical protein
VDSRRRWLVAALALFRRGRGGVVGLGSSSGRWESSLEGQFGRREFKGGSSTINSSLPAAMVGYLGMRDGRGSAAPFIGRARGGEMSWVAGAALRVKGRAGRAEGTRGSGSVGRRSSWHVIGGSLPRGQCKLGRGGFGDRAVGLGKAKLGEPKWRRRPGGAVVVRQGGRALRRREEGEGGRLKRKRRKQQGSG